MKYYTRTIDEERVVNLVMQRLLKSSISFVVDPVTSSLHPAWEVTVKIEDRQRLNMAVHYSGGKMEE